jgi:tRNA 2-thiouridine synthesizing protein A
MTVERRTVDIRAHVCPMTWVRVKLALEAAAPGELLEVLLRGEEPVRNVPRAAEREGHQVVELAAVGDHHRLVLRRC